MVVKLFVFYFKGAIRQRGFNKVLILGAFAAILYLLYSFFYLLFHDYLRDPSYLERDKCPACYGESLCDELTSGKITFESISKYRFTDYINTKNVYFAKRIDGTPMVLKKLAFNFEFVDLDAQICMSTSRSKDCDVSKLFYIHKFTKREIESKTFANLSDMVRCPSLRMLNRVLDNYKERKSRRYIHVEDKLFLGYTLSVNPEPILMQLFPREEGWPFPKYYGACGRFVAVEYVGQTLNNYFDAPWEERVDFAYQILNIAKMFTNNRQGYNLYLADVTYDNLAVDKDGKIVIIDLENIIVVDQAIIKREKRPHWRWPFYSPFDVCSPSTSCLSFSYEDMCSRLTLDHNYYAVCRNLLSHYASDVLMSDGFLHSLPEHLESKYNISAMLEECAKPTTHGGRLIIVPKLIAALEDIRRDYF